MEALPQYTSKDQGVWGHVRRRANTVKTKWSLSDIPRLDGRVAIVTGANSGVGYEIALQLVLHGARVVLAARDKGRMEEAVRRIKMTDARPEHANTPLGKI